MIPRRPGEHLPRLDVRLSVLMSSDAIGILSDCHRLLFGLFRLGGKLRLKHSCWTVALGVGLMQIWIHAIRFGAENSDCIRLEAVVDN